MELASTCPRAHTGLEGTANSVAIAGRDRWFESTSLQRQVCKPPVPRGGRRPGMNLASRRAIAGSGGTVDPQEGKEKRVLQLTDRFGRLGLGPLPKTTRRVMPVWASESPI
jgi:hypothetical protein